MKITIDAKAMSGALGLLGRVIEAKSPMPIYQSLKIVTNDSRVILTGANYDETVEITLAAGVATEGEALVAFEPLAKFIGAAKGGTVEISIGADGATVKSGRGRIVLATGHVEDYPTPKAATGEAATLDGPSLCTALRYCAAAAADDEARYYLNGVCIKQGADGLEFWGTDGHAMHHAFLPEVSEIGGGGIVPTDAVNLILSIADKAETPRLMVCETGWHLVAGSVQAFGKVIDGTFPAVDRVIADLDANGGLARFVTASREDVAATLAVATVGADTQANKARSLVIRGTAGQPVVMRGFKGVSGVVTAGRAEMEATAEITFAGVVNAALLAAAVSGSVGADVALSIANNGQVFRVDPAQGSATLTMFAVVMGIRASEEEMADAA